MNIVNIVWMSIICVSDFFFFWVALGFELRGLYLLGRCSTTWAALPLEPLHQPFLVFDIFKKGSHFCCLGYLWTVILLISASWVARITDMSHQMIFNTLTDYICINKIPLSRSTHKMKLCIEQLMRTLHWAQKPTLKSPWEQCCSTYSFSVCNDFIEHDFWEHNHQPYLGFTTVTCGNHKKTKEKEIGAD
jgi:hypothetical protein